jgi:hypothetical protein
MSRFGTYLDTKKLASMFLIEAEEAVKKNDQGRALRRLTQAMREFLIAMNNLASMHFEPKRRGVGRPRK